MQIRRFRVDDFESYLSWFEDAELNAQLGPMDEEWLAYVMSSEEGAQFSFTVGDELLAVAGVQFPAPGYDCYYLSDLAIQPQRRRQGLGRQALALLLAHPGLQATAHWRCGVAMPGNPAALAFFSLAGWQSRQVDEADAELLELEFLRGG